MALFHFAGAARQRLSVFLLLLVFVSGMKSADAAAYPATAKPRLVVMIVVDQMRADYLDRFNDLFLPPGKSGRDAGGFRFLRERGAQFPSARYKHFPLFTGPGHAVVSTGGYPYKTGIVGNDWYVKATRSPMYCVQDDAVKVVGALLNSTAEPMSPRNLRSTTVSDELKMATGGQARVVSLSLKDRAAILLGGHLPDAALWFDASTGQWISSSFYCKSGQLPAWAQALNARKLPDAYFGQSWNLNLPATALRRLWNPPMEPPFPAVSAIGAAFPHRIDGGLKSPGAAFYKAFVLTPWANGFVLNTAKAAVLSQSMGQDETPDLLEINLASNDYVGHAFGPNSPEVMDITVQTDRQLSDFFRFLDRSVPGGLKNVTIALTADHGVAPVPDTMTAAGFHAGRILTGDVIAAANKALDGRFGARDWALHYVEPYLYLDDAALTSAKADPEVAQQVAARAIAALDGIYAAYPRAQLEEGRLPGTDLSAHLYRGFYPKVSGDVMIVTEQNYFTQSSPESHDTTHGTPYAYDTEVPLLLAGYGIRPGTYREDVGPADIAPSLCSLLGIGRPSACDGTPLVSALR